MRYDTEAKKPSFVLSPGEYPAMIESAEEKTSKAGNPMLVVEMNVYKNDGTTVIIKDYMITGGQYSADWKIKNLCKSAGIAVTGSIDCADLIGHGIRVKLGIKPAEGKFNEQNKVLDYLIVSDSDDQPKKVDKIKSEIESQTDDENSPPF